MKKVLSVVISLALLAVSTSSQAFWFFKDEYTKTKYPIVMAHGMMGFDNIGGVDYWYGIIDELKRSGADVHVAHMSAMNSSEFRAEQLLKQVQDVLAVTGAEKVNLMGHSHGTHAIRYVAAVLPGRVASVTAIGGPIKGSPVADFIKNALEKDTENKYAPTLFKLASSLGGVFNQLAGKKLPQDAEAGMNSLTLAGSADFNARFPAGVPATQCGEGDYIANGVRYYSWSGTGTTQSDVTHIFDPLSWAMLPLAPIFKGEATDGLVGRCSSHLGQVLRDDYNLDHLDEVNHLLGMRSWFSADPKSIYRQQANRLKQAGL